MATQVAKMLLLGETVVIVNSEKAVITGPKDKVFASFKQKRERGIPLNGPYYPRRPDMIVKRTIRGMLPYKQEKGETAFKRLKCHVSI
ncbi:MAG: 50S ribosomal protein L13, partial [Nanoarchaeota archaeon]